MSKLAVSSNRVVVTLTQQDVNAAYGDIGTILPDGILRPAHWDTETFDPLAFASDPKYDAWLAAGAPAGKPVADMP